MLLKSILTKIKFGRLEREISDMSFYEELDTFEKNLVDTNARFIMSNDFDVEQIPIIVQLLSKTLKLNEKQTRSLLKRRIKQIVLEDLKKMTDKLDPVKKSKKNDDNSSEKSEEMEVDETESSSESLSYENYESEL